MIRLLVEPDAIDVTPGFAVPVTITVVNDGAATEQVTLRLVGVDASWIADMPEMVEVFGGDQREVPVSVTLPFGYPAGAQLIGVEGTTPGAARPAIGSLQLVVADIDGVSVRLSPASFRGGRKGRFKLNVINRGKKPISLTLTGRSAGQTTEDAGKKGDLTFRFRPEEITLRPGERVRAKGRVTGRRPVAGAPRTRPLTIVAQSNSSPLYVDGRFTQRPIMSKKIFKVIGLVCVMALWAGGLIAGINFTKGSAPETAADASAELGPSGESGATGPNGEVLVDTDGDGVPDSPAGPDGALGPDGQPLAPGEGITPGQTEGAVISGQVTGLTDRAGVLVSLAAVMLPSDAAAIEPGTEVVPPSKSSSSKSSKSSTKGKVFAQSAPTDEAADAGGAKTTETDDQGFWSFAGLDKASYQLTFSKVGFGQRTYVVTVAEENENIPLEVELAAADGSLAGTVVDSAGAAIGGATISITDGTVTYKTTTPTDGGGEWSVGGLSTPGTYLVTASRRGFGNATLSVSLAGSDDQDGIELTLVPGVGSISGTISGGSDDAKPLGGITVTAASDAVTRSVTTLTEDPIGFYTLPQLPIGAVYTLTVSGPGWVSETKLIDLDDFDGGNATEVDSTLRTTTGRVLGTVTDEAGKELASVGVTISQDDPLVKSLTSETGDFDLVGLTPGTYTATFELFNYESQSAIVELAEGGEVVLAIKLVATPVASKAGDATIRGTVRDGITGLPIPTVTVTAGDKTGTSDPNGAFVLEGLKAGTVAMTFTHANHEKTTRTERPGVKADITIDQLMLPFAGLQGRVTDLTATPISGVSISVAAQTGTLPISAATVVTDANGGYLIPQAMPTGSYTATFSKIGFGIQTRDFEASAGSNSVADVQLVELGTITGAVQEPGGGVGGFLTLSNVTITINKLVGGVVQTPPVFGPVVVNGSYTVSGLQPADYRVTATHGVNGTTTRDLIGLKLREIRDGGIVLARTPVPGAVNGQVFFTAGSTRTGIVGATITAQIVTGFSILPTFPFVSPQLQTVTVTSLANGALIPGSSPARFAPSAGYWEMTPPPVPGSVSNYTTSITGFVQKTVGITSPTASGSGDFAMVPEPQNITGTATLSDAAAGVVVTATLTSASLTAPLTDAPTTNGSGVATYSFTSLSPGTYTVTLTRNGYHIGTDTVTLNSGASAGTINAGDTTLQKQSSIAITVRNNTGGGALVNGAAVTLTALSGTTFTQTITTGASGIAAFPSLTDRTYRVSVSRTGYDTGTSAAAATATMIADEVLIVGEDATLTVTLQEHPDLTVNVTGRIANLLSVNTDTLLSNANVSAAPVGGGAVITLGTTGSPGAYLAEQVPPGDYRVTIVVPLHETFTTASFTLTAGTDPVRNEIVLKLPTIIANLQKNVGGTTSAFDDTVDGTPTVTATPTAGGAPITLTKTSTGTYAANAIATGTYQISASSTGYSSDTATIATVVAGTTRETTAGSLVLDKFANLTVTVNTDTDPGAPVVLATIDAESVTATPTGGSAIPLTHQGAVSSGLYSVSSISPGTYAITVTKSSYVVGTTSVTVSAGGAPAPTVTLVEFPDATVTVNDGVSGIPNAAVTATPVGGGTAVTFTDAGGGSYTANNVPTGNYTLSASAAGYATATGVAGNFQSTTAGTITGTTTLTLTIAASIRINVTEVDGTTAIDDATVVLRAINSTNPASRVRVTGDDGSGSVVFSELGPLAGGVGQPGYRITISKIGYADFEIDEQGLATGSSLVLAVSLNRQSIVSVNLTSRLSGRADVALTGGTVTATLGAAHYTAVPLFSGVYFFPALPPGNWTIEATAPDHASRTALMSALGTAVVASVDQNVTMVMQAHPTQTVTLTGGLTGSLAAISGALVTATPTTGGGGAVVLTETSTTGTYKSAPLTAGLTYTLAASKAGYVLQATASTGAVVAGTALTSAPLVLFALSDLTVNVTGGFTGSESAAGGSAAVVTATPSGGGAAVILPETSTAGTYKATSLPIGTYTLSATKAGYTLTGAAVTRSSAAGTAITTAALLLARHTDLTVTVTGGLTGSLTSGGGSGALVTATPTGGAPIVLGETTTAGTYTTSVLAPGTYAVQATRAGYAVGAAPASVTSVAGTQLTTVTRTLLIDPSLTVTVTSSIDGLLAGAIVTAVPAGGGDEISLDDITGGDYKVNSIAPNTYTVTVAATSHITKSTINVIVAPGVAATLAVTINKQSTLSVTVNSKLDATLTPFDGATVIATRTVGGALVVAVPQKVSTAAAGDYEVSGIPAGTYTVSATGAGHTGASDATSAVVVVGANPAARTVNLLRYPTLVVDVTGGLVSGPPDSAGGAGAIVVATPTTGSPITLATTATAGRYQAVAIPPGGYTVTASKAGYTLTASAAVTSTAGADFSANTDIELLLNPSLTVNVTSNTLGLIDTAVVTATPVASGDTLELPVVTGGTAGDYTVNSVAPGTYSVRVEAPSHAVTTIATVVVVAGVNKIQAATVNKAATLTITVRSAVNGGAAANLLASTTLATVTATESTTGALVQLTSTGAGNATYSVTEIPAGTYTVTASATGYATGTSSSITIANGTNDTDDTVTMQQHPTLSVVVTGDPLSGSSAALSGATVLATPTAGGPAVTVPESGTAGTYTFLRLTPGQYSVSVTKSGYSTPSAQTTTSTAGAALSPALTTFALSELPTLTVDANSVVVVGVPFGGGPTNITTPLATAIVTADAGGPVYTLTNLGNGHYSVPIPTSGTYTVTVTANGHTTTAGSRAVALGATPALLTVDAPATAGNITGTVKDVQGLALSGVSVTGTNGAFTIGPVTTNGSGVFTLGGSIPALTWTLTYTAPTGDYGNLSQSVTVPKGATIVADAFLAPLGASIVGQVFGKASALTSFGPGNELSGLGGINVNLTSGPDSPLGPATLRTDGSGNFYFMFANLEPGTYEVTFTDPAGSPVYDTLVVSSVVVANAAVVTVSPALTKTDRSVTFTANTTVAGVQFRITNSGLLASPGYLTTAVTNASGVATLTDIPPGTYAVTVTTTPAGFAETNTAAGTLTVPDAPGNGTYGESFTPVGTVTGTILKNDDAVAAAVGDDGNANGTVVTVTNATFTASATVAGGTFTISNVPAATDYTVTFELSGYVTETLTSQTVTGGGTLTLNRQLDKLSTFTVTVTDQNGTALNASSIRLVAIDGLTPITNALGVETPIGSGSSYTFENLLPGTSVYVRVLDADYTQLAEATGGVRVLDAGANTAGEGRTAVLTADGNLTMSVSGLAGAETATVTFTWTAIAGITGSVGVTFTGTTNTTATVSVPANTSIAIGIPNSSAAEAGTITAAATTPDDLDVSPFTFAPEGTGTLTIAYA